MTLDRRQWMTGLSALGITAAAHAASPLWAATSSKKRESRKRRDAKSPDTHVDVAIIGAGALGAWTAWHLVRRGQNVRIFDAYGAGNGRAASNLQTMFLDPTQGGDALYASMAQRALDGWQNLSNSASLPIVTPCSVLTGLGASEAATIAAAANSSAQSADMLRRSYPQMLWQDGEYAIANSGGGMIAGRRAILETLADARLSVEDIVMPAPLQDKRQQRYTLPDGGTATHLLYACGAWLTEVFPQLITPAKLSAVRHQLFHFGAGQGDVQYRMPAMPAVVDRHFGFTALPDLEGRGVRVWSHRPDASIDPDSFDRRSDDRALAACRQWLAARLPRLANAPVVNSQAAHDCRTNSGDLLMDRFPNHNRVWMLSGGAGRAFGLAPAIGERMADHILDANRAVEPRWSLPSLTGSIIS
ncbi:NAD(P)/FAD-dependent oxidoreductase [Sphingopyxis yananensis]|uniref:NAD(P)/FAD-dependent oxidoreductase n=1 Tax=Sphingopyxis yananensis TaxID=2886687 RepID=UPI001D11E7A7|nr:FAD-binding oxidoreductase [Sphingopyxis yananensis]MCC2602621.1 FAD-binding oxidoreductase [Sphingopyxis yananensis]